MVKGVGHHGHDEAMEAGGRDEAMEAGGRVLDRGTIVG